jgi:SAM-dependent methyltransferase
VSWLWLQEPGQYAGYRLKSPPGLQEAAMEILLRHDPPRSSVLDLASGGAMLARLGEAGFSDLHAVARDPSLVGETDSAVPEEWNVTSLDLNRSFADHFGRRFGLVVSSEAIEHLDSPRVFLAEVHRLLEEDGYLLLTTPNVANWAGRIQFVLFGELRWFDERMYRKARHISPITDVQMRAMLTEAGFDLVATTSAGSFSGPLRALLTAPLSLPFLALFGRRGWGDCNIYLAKRTRGPDSSGT